MGKRETGCEMKDIWAGILFYGFIRITRLVTFTVLLKPNVAVGHSGSWSPIPMRHILRTAFMRQVCQIRIQS